MSRSTEVTSPADRLTRQLSAWPGVCAGRAECGVGTGFRASRQCNGHQIVHVHGDAWAEICLTRPVIARLGKALVESGQVEVVPGHDWVRVRLDAESDVTLAASLVSVSIQAATPVDPAASGRRPAPCQEATARSPMGRRRPRFPRAVLGGLS